MFPVHALYHRKRDSSSQRQRDCAKKYRDCVDNRNRVCDNSSSLLTPHPPPAAGYRSGPTDQ